MTKLVAKIRNSDSTVVFDLDDLAWMTDYYVIQNGKFIYLDSESIKPYVDPETIPDYNGIMLNAVVGKCKKVTIDGKQYYLVDDVENAICDCIV